MSGQPFRYSIYLKLLQRRKALAEIGQKFLDSLDALSAINPLFTPWKVVDFAAVAKVPLAVARSRIAAVVEEGVVRDDYDQPEPESGYMAIGVTDNFKASRVAKLTVDAGAVFLPNRVMLEVGDPLAPTDPGIVNYPLFRNALIAITAVWQPAYSYAYAFRLDYDKAPIVPGAPLIRYNPFHLPWIGYLSPEIAAGLVVPPADVRAEAAPGGGLLLSATAERFDPTNLDHLRRAHILTETMIACTGDGD
jgi:hypothetical protein